MQITNTVVIQMGYIFSRWEKISDDFVPRF